MRSLNKLLTDVFYGGHVAPKRKPKSASHFQVYTNKPGAHWNHNPAYEGNDRAKADAIALKVGGTVEVVGFACAREVIRA